jgi:hypothetical protein
MAASIDRPSTERHPTMSKDQKHGNKEARKPKGSGKKAAPAAAATTLMANSLPLGRMPKAKS